MGTCRYVSALQLGDLANVNLTSPIDEDILVYDAGTSKWVNLSIHDFIGGLNFDFFLSDTADGVIAGYLRMFDAPTGEGESSANALIVAADTAIEEWITAADQPTFTLLSAGVYSLHFHADKDGPGKKDVRVYAELYKRAAGGAETLLMTFENSALLTTSPAQYEIHATLLAEETIASDDRLVLKTLGTPEGAGADPTVTIYMEGATATRLEVRSTPAALDERYLRLDSANPMTADLQMDGQNIDDLGVLFLIEQAAADPDVPGSGQIWVKTATPNELWFTDDAGTDVQLGLAGGGDVTAAANIADHSVVRGDGGAKGVQDSGVIIDDNDNVGIGGVPNATFGNLHAQSAGSTYLVLENTGAAADTKKKFTSSDGGSMVFGHFNDIWSITNDMVISPDGIITQPGQSGARVYLSATQTIAGDNQWDKMHFVTTSFDTQNEFVPWDVGDDANTGRFVATEDGKYKVILHARMDSMADGKYVEINLRINGGAVGGFQMYAPAASNLGAVANDVFELSASDYIDGWVRHNSGVNKNISSGGGIRTYIVVVKIA